MVMTVGCIVVVLASCIGVDATIADLCSGDLCLGGAEALSLIQLEKFNHSVARLNKTRRSPHNKTERVLARDDGGAKLADVADVMSKPAAVVKEMGVQLGAIEERLKAMQYQSTVAMKKQKASFERKLIEQMDQNHAVKLANDNISAQIEYLRMSSSKRRLAAEHLMAKNLRLKSELEDMQRNFSIAEEFADHTLISTNGQLKNSSELQILADLDAMEAVEAKETAHQNRLSLIASHPTMSMLELGTRSLHGSIVNPQDLLQTLLGSLGQLSDEQNASEVALKESFEKHFLEGEEQHQLLLKAQAELNSTMETESRTHERLKVAVLHLKKVHDQLAAQTAQLRLFAKRLGDVPVPLPKASTPRAEESASFSTMSATSSAGTTSAAIAGPRNGTSML